jgi:hypothetical protein
MGQRTTLIFHWDTKKLTTSAFQNAPPQFDQKKDMPLSWTVLPFLSTILLPFFFNAPWHSTGVAHFGGSGGGDGEGVGVGDEQRPQLSLHFTLMNPGLFAHSPCWLQYGQFSSSSAHVSAGEADPQHKTQTNVIGTIFCMTFE